MRIILGGNDIPDGEAVTLMLEGNLIPPFSPLDIPGCALWLDASQIDLEDGDPVATWPDMSSNGYDATQAMAELRPTFRADVLGSGLHVVRFATGPWMQLTGAGLGLFRALDGASAMFVFSSDQGGAILEAEDGAQQGYSRFAFHPLPLDIDVSNTDSDVSISANMDTDQSGYSASDLYRSRPCFIVADFAGGGLIYGDGVRQAAHRFPSPGPTPDTASDFIVIGANDAGGSNPFEGDLAELVVWQRVLDARKQRQVLEYLSDKWGTL
jgi:hypothetical protein